MGDSEKPMNELLQVENLRVNYKTYQGTVQAVRGVSFTINEGETVALVGESGCGKSVTAKSVLRLIRDNGSIEKGSVIRFEGEDILKLKKADLKHYKGEKVSIVFQDALASLNPTMKVGKQITEMLTQHYRLSKAEARKQAVEILKVVGIPDAESRFDLYPHSFSGGQRQRVMIGMAVSCKPKLLIADEPTTALDVTVQDQILTLLRELQENHNTAILLITHDLGVVANIAQRVYVMYAGQIMEEGTVKDIYYNPKHPYTWALLKAVPRLDNDSREDLASIEGAPPDLISPPEGCPFAARCKYCMKVCLEHAPVRQTFEGCHAASCWLNDPEAPKFDFNMG